MGEELAALSQGCEMGGRIGSAIEFEGFPAQRVDDDQQDALRWPLQIAPDEREQQ